jgi:hypothetical protein
MSKIEILEELPKLTKTERQEIRLRLAELDSEDWLDDADPLTVHEKRYLRRASPLTRRIRTLVAHGKKLRAESEPALLASRRSEPASNHLEWWLAGEDDD